MEPDQTVPIGAVCSGSTLFPSIPNWSVMLGNYLQQTTSANNIFRFLFFLGAMRVNKHRLLNLFTFIQRGDPPMSESNDFNSSDSVNSADEQTRVSEFMISLLYEGQSIISLTNLTLMYTHMQDHRFR